MKEANEVYLFHGSEKWLDISQTGFEVKYAGSNKGSAYGRGIYFAESPSKVSWCLLNVVRVTEHIFCRHRRINTIEDLAQHIA